MAWEPLIQFFEQVIPFNAHLGVKVVHLEKGRCRIRVPFSPFLVGDPFRPALHGGVMTSLADAAGGLAVFSTFPTLETRVSTVDIRCDYLRPGRLEDLECEAVVVRVGNRVAVTTMTLRQGDDYVPAECRGVYNLMRPDSNAAE